MEHNYSPLFFNAWTFIFFGLWFLTFLAWIIKYAIEIFFVWISVNIGSKVLRNRGYGKGRRW